MLARAIVAFSGHRAQLPAVLSSLMHFLNRARRRQSNYCLEGTSRVNNRFPFSLQVSSPEVAPWSGPVYFATFKQFHTTWLNMPFTLWSKAPIWIAFAQPSLNEFPISTITSTLLINTLLILRKFEHPVSVLPKITNAACVTSKWSTSKLDKYNFPRRKVCIFYYHSFFTGSTLLRILQRGKSAVIGTVPMFRRQNQARILITGQNTQIERRETRN